MTQDEKQKLTTALDVGGPLPWPQTIGEEIALEERKLADPLRDHAPRTAPQRKVRSVLAILDQLDRKANPNRRFND